MTIAQIRMGIPKTMTLCTGQTRRTVWRGGIAHAVWKDMETRTRKGTVQIRRSSRTETSRSGHTGIEATGGP